MRKFAVLVAETGTNFEVIGEPTDKPEDLKKALRAMVTAAENAGSEPSKGSGSARGSKKAMASKYVEAAVVHSTKGMLSRRRF